MTNTIATVKDLFNTNRAFRVTVYAVLGLLTFAACFELGVHFGEFLYVLMH